MTVHDCADCAPNPHERRAGTADAALPPLPFPVGWKLGDGWTPGQLADHDAWVTANAVRDE